MNDKQVIGIAAIMFSLIGFFLVGTGFFDQNQKPLNLSNHPKKYLNKIKTIIIALFFLAFVPSAAFAETQMDKDPFAPGSQFDSKPLDEHEQDEQFLTDLWTMSIIIVVCAIIARIAFQIVKKRMKKSNQSIYNGAGGNLLKQSAHRSSLVVIPFGNLKLNFLTEETENF